MLTQTEVQQQRKMIKTQVERISNIPRPPFCGTHPLVMLPAGDEVFMIQTEKKNLMPVGRTTHSILVFQEVNGYSSLILAEESA